MEGDTTEVFSIRLPCGHLIDEPVKAVTEVTCEKHAPVRRWRIEKTYSGYDARPF